MTPLLKLELRRQRPMVLKMALLTAFVCGVFYLVGKRAPVELLAAIAGSGLGALLIVPMGISRDKMEGTLDFICGLPVEPREIAASRFAAMALIATPWAVAIGAMAFAAPGEPPMHPVALAVLSWLAMLVLGAGGIAMMTLFELETLLGFPFVAMVLVVVLVPRVARAFLPGVSREALIELVRRPEAPLAISLVLIVVPSVVGAVAFAAAVRGFSAYMADPARR
jgi:hypothetical protein